MLDKLSVVTISFFPNLGFILLHAVFPLVGCEGEKKALPHPTTRLMVNSSFWYVHWLKPHTQQKIHKTLSELDEGNINRNSKMLGNARKGFRLFPCSTQLAKEQPKFGQHRANLTNAKQLESYFSMASRKIFSWCCSSLSASWCFTFMACTKIS